MPTTSPNSLPYPVLADAPHGPDQIEDLAVATQTALNTKSGTGHTHAYSPDTHDHDATYAKGYVADFSSSTTSSSSVNNTPGAYVNERDIVTVSGREYLILAQVYVGNTGTAGACYGEVQLWVEGSAVRTYRQDVVDNNDANRQHITVYYKFTAADASVNIKFRANRVGGAGTYTILSSDFALLDVGP
jgi:hypothetical protein